MHSIISCSPRQGCTRWNKSLIHVQRFGDRPRHELQAGYKVTTFFLSGSEGQFGNVGVTRCTKKKHLEVSRPRNRMSFVVTHFKTMSRRSTTDDSLHNLHENQGESHTWTHTCDTWNLKVSLIFPQYAFWWFLICDNTIFCILVMLLSTVCSVIMGIYRLSIFYLCVPASGIPAPPTRFKTSHSHAMLARCHF